MGRYLEGVAPQGRTQGRQPLSHIIKEFDDLLV